MDQKNKILSEGILLALFPLIGYIIAISFEVGYGAFFNIPLRFIEIDLIAILVSTVVALVYFYIIFSYLNWIVRFTNMKHPIARAIGRILMWMLTPVVFVLISGGHEISLYGLLAMLGYGIIVYLLLPIIPDKENINYLERINKAVNEVSPISNIDESNKHEVFVNNIQGFIGVIFFGSLICAGAGHYWAKQETSFWVVESEDKIIIRKYGDHLFLKKYIEEEKMFCEETEVVNLNDLKKFTLINKNLGKLEKFE